MLLTRDDPISGIRNSRHLPITPDEYRRWQAGELAQNVWPHLTPSDREFIITGITDETWSSLFPDEAPAPIIKGSSVP